MKLLKVFALFSILHLLGWIGAHIHKTNNPNEILVVVDTSFAMKEHFPAMQHWIDEFEDNSRYSVIMIGSDKAEFGELSLIRSKDVLFRTVFGRLSTDNLKRYEHSQVGRKYLLSDGSVRPPDWTVVTF